MNDLLESLRTPKFQSLRRNGSIVIGACVVALVLAVVRGHNAPTAGSGAVTPHAQSGPVRGLISQDGLTGAENLNAWVSYTFDRRHRYIQPDNALISLPRFNAIQRGMTPAQVVKVMGVGPKRQVFVHGQYGVMHWDNGPVFIDVNFDEFGVVIGKTRNFDGPAERPDRWNQFWTEPHAVIPQ
jgi:hypothetical protein